ncbi:NACHT domain-containing protein [Actinomadura alba]|uniref:NACHT domain-containing protein n=1 Tax=Actinomadura alba TaxID=406431 RepID=A0ABR7M208_9ACTN|nr:NACHT domain-containing protein [Actinomadura alba]MBC6471157.1 NACHT domain-containing protein [Actinomadura alba]
MTANRSRPPGPTAAGTAADFVRSLVRLRRWAGEPPLSRLRSLGGQTVTPDGAAVDTLPKSTTSHVLRQTDKLPRWDFVKAFVTACLRYGDYPAEQIPGELERWRAARSALARSVTPVSPPPDTEEPTSPAAAPEPLAETPVAAAAEVLSETSVAGTVAGTAQATAAAVAGVAADTTGRPGPDHAFELLARRVAREEDRTRKGLLGGYSIAPVAFGTHADPIRPDDATGEVKGDLHSVGRFFGGLRPQRLLVVGESGAGKTVLAIELVLRLVEPLVTADERPGGRPMVPVRLNAARWTLGSPFETWLAEQLVQDFGLAAKDAARLVRDRRVLPVVDGLDELDPGPSTGPPRRAIGLLAELNRYSDLSGRRPGAVVVTCRSDRYAELSDARVGLDNAARIHLHDLTVEHISAYLHARWPDGHPRGTHRDGIEEALSGPSGPAVHAALATPWRLLLTATAVESGADPAELLRADPYAEPGEAAARIARGLLGTYVPAATELTPRTAYGTPYQPVQVRSWLVRLAAHLQWQAAHAAETDRPPPGLTAIDIVPHLLWPIGGRRRVRVLHYLCCVVFAVVAMLAFWTGSAVDDPGDLRDGLDVEEALTLALMAGWVGIATGLSLSSWPAAAGGRANVPLRRRMAGGLLGAVVGGPVGVLGGMAGFVLTDGRVFGPVFATAAGAAGGMVFGALIGLTASGRRGAERMTISAAVRAEPVTLLGFGLCGALTGLPPLRLAHAGPMPLAVGGLGAFALAFALGVVFKVATGGWSKDAELAHPREALHRNPTIGVAFGLTGGVAAFLVFVMNQGVIQSLACALIGGVNFGLAFGAIAWCRTMIGLVVAAARGLLPLRLWTFLDWACEARLLRVSGATYQFRHRELQDFLTPSEGPTAAEVAGRLQS